MSAPDSKPISKPAAGALRATERGFPQKQPPEQPSPLNLRRLSLRCVSDSAACPTARLRGSGRAESNTPAVLPVGLRPTIIPWHSWACPNKSNKVNNVNNVPLDARRQAFGRPAAPAPAGDGGARAIATLVVLSMWSPRLHAHKAKKAHKYISKHMLRA